MRGRWLRGTVASCTAALPAGTAAVPGASCPSSWSVQASPCLMPARRGRGGCLPSWGAWGGLSSPGADPNLWMPLSLQARGCRGAGGGDGQESAKCVQSQPRAPAEPAGGESSMGGTARAGGRVRAGSEWGCLQSIEPQLHAGGVSGHFPHSQGQVPSCHPCLQNAAGPWMTMTCPYAPIGTRKSSRRRRSWALAWWRWQRRPEGLLPPSSRQTQTWLRSSCRWLLQGR